MIAFGVVVGFLLPALLDGKPAIPVALVAGAVILYAVPLSGARGLTQDQFGFARHPCPPWCSPRFSPTSALN